MDKYIIKIETNGLNPLNNDIYSIYLKKIGGNSFNLYLNSENVEKEKPEYSSIEDYEAWKISKKFNFNQLVNIFKQIIPNNVIIGWNISFDLNFILYKLSLIKETIDISNTQIIDLQEIEKNRHKIDIVSTYNRYFEQNYNEERRYNSKYNGEIFELLYNKYTDEETNPKSIFDNDLINEEGVFKSGKHVNESVKNVYKVDTSYISYLLNKANIIFKYNILRFLK